jgi:hypothetical protein
VGASPTRIFAPANSNRSSHDWGILSRVDLSPMSASGREWEFTKSISMSRLSIFETPAVQQFYPIFKEIIGPLSSVKETWALFLLQRSSVVSRRPNSVIYVKLADLPLVARRRRSRKLG